MKSGYELYLGLSDGILGLVSLANLHTDPKNPRGTRTQHQSHWRLQEVIDKSRQIEPAMNSRDSGLCKYEDCSPESRRMAGHFSSLSEQCIPEIVQRVKWTKFMLGLANLSNKIPLIIDTGQLSLRFPLMIQDHVLSSRINVSTFRQRWTTLSNDSWPNIFT